MSQNSSDLPSEENKTSKSSTLSCLGLTDDMVQQSSSSSFIEPKKGQKRHRNTDNSEDSLMVVTAAMMAGCAALLGNESCKKRRVSGVNSHLLNSPISFRMITDFYGPVMFRKTFRMSRSAFETLLGTVSDLLERKFVSGSIYRRETIPPDIRLAITLRVIAGGSYCDICLAYQVKDSTISEIAKSTCDALMERLHLEGLPRTKAALHSIARGFQTSRPETSPIYGCVGALDGICIEIRKPAASENPATFYSRKGFYALPVQALCDSNYIFRYCSVVCTGATHDALAFAVSGIKRDIDSGILGVVFFIVGDEAYMCTEALLTPYRSGDADFDQVNFNYFLSSLRIHIEQAFGMLVARWRILKGGLQYSVSRSSDIICLLMKLHNFCITWDGVESGTELYSEEEKEMMDADVKQWCRKTHEIADEFRARSQRRSAQRPSGSRKRDALVAIVKEKNMRRPNPVPLTAPSRV